MHSNRIDLDSLFLSENKKNHNFLGHGFLELIPLFVCKGFIFGIWSIISSSNRHYACMCVRICVNLVVFQGLCIGMKAVP